jgi:hypothetical protein
MSLIGYLEIWKCGLLGSGEVVGGEECCWSILADDVFRCCHGKSIVPTTKFSLQTD